jgi:hypothetical protein
MASEPKSASSIRAEAKQLGANEATQPVELTTLSRPFEEIKDSNGAPTSSAVLYREHWISSADEPRMSEEELRRRCQLIDFKLDHQRATTVAPMLVAQKSAADWFVFDVIGVSRRKLNAKLHNPAANLIGRLLETFIVGVMRRRDPETEPNRWVVTAIALLFLVAGVGATMLFAHGLVVLLGVFELWP